MVLANNYQKFKKHLKADSLLYAVWRGIKYFIYLIKRKRDKLKRLPREANKPLERMVIGKGGLKVVCSFSSYGINIFWNDCEVTKNPGLNIAIDTLGLWTGSPKADWQALDKGGDFFKIKVALKELPLTQMWTIKIRNEQEIEWQIDMDVEEWLRIDEFRIVCFVNSRYKTWMSNYLYADFPRLDKHWHNLYLNNHPVSLVGVRFPTSGQFLPPFILESQDKNLFSLIQNPPLDTNSRVIGFRNIGSKRRAYLPGYHHFFTGKINLFKEDYFLDSKIETLRQESLRRVRKKITRNRKK